MKGVTTTIVPNDRGTEDVRIEAAGKDGARLAKEIDAAFKEELRTQLRNARFSGQFHVIVGSRTPLAERRYVVPVVERARLMCAELSTGGEPYRLTLSYEGKPSLHASPVGLGAATARPSPAEPVDAADGRSARVWIGASVAVAILLGAAWWYFVANRLPRSLDFGRARLTRVSSWTRDGVTGGSYLLPGDSPASATVRLNALSSASLTSAAALGAWAHGEYRRSRVRTYYDVDTGSEACRLDTPASATPASADIHLEICRSGAGRAVCAEVTEPLPPELVTTCEASANPEARTACFNDTCVKRRQARADALGAVVAGLLAQ